MKIGLTCSRDLAKFPKFLSECLHQSIKKINAMQYPETYLSFITGDAKSDRKGIKFGFASVGCSPILGDIIYSKYGRFYLHIIFLKAENKYICTGITEFYKNKTPEPFNLHEFLIFYGGVPPILSNNKNGAVNELVQNIVVS